ncbi:MAG: cupredoxin domain-containing protein [Coriobacteriales bacterium]|nr:cupredoxin domain-containing protein [Coriobacteriales bacterium]
MTTQNTNQASNRTRMLVIGVLIVAAFFGAYKFAAALSAPSSQGAAPVAGVSGAPVAGGGGAQGGGGCCGNGQAPASGVTGDTIEGAAAVEGDVQRISVDVSSGTYNPNAIKLKAGVPAEITFANGSGCTGQVYSDELGFFEDMSGGPVTVKLKGLEKGEYPFYCGMKMVFGKIVVE